MAFIVGFGMPRGKRSPGFTQISISIPKVLLEQIDEEAAVDNRSRSNWIVTELAAAVKSRGQSRGKDASNAPPGKSPAGTMQQDAGRADVRSAGAGSRVTAFPSSRPDLNEDAPREIPPVIPAREKTQKPKATRARVALREMQQRESGKKA